jgi:tetratricopeptide (TPR) repeat protein
MEDVVMRQILLVALLSWFSIPAAALSQELGEFVVVVAETAQLREGSKVVGTLNRGDQLRIDGIENRRYLALSTWDYTHGWIDTKDVIPLDEGVEFFTQAIQRNPTPVDFAARGLVWVITGETDKAIADFDKAIEMQPAFVTAYLRRAIAFANKDDFDKAVNDCTEAIRLDPSNAEPYCSRGAVLSAKGDHDKALRDFDQAVRLNPNSGAVHFSRGAELQH